MRYTDQEKKRVFQILASITIALILAVVGVAIAQNRMGLDKNYIDCFCDSCVLNENPIKIEVTR